MRQTRVKKLEALLRGVKVIRMNHFKPKTPLQEVWKKEWLRRYEELIG